MIRSFRLLAVFGLFALMTAGCGVFSTFSVEQGSVSRVEAAFTPGEEITVTGTVVGSIDECAFDGNCAHVLNVDGAEVNVIWAQGMMQCQGQYDDGIQMRHIVEAFGVAVDRNSLTICTSPEYYVRRAE